MGRLVVEISARDQGAARQLDQVTSRLGMIETTSNNARRENIRLRDSIIRINERIAENNRLILKADDATRQSLQAKNRALRSERELLNVQSARSRQNLAGLQQERRELRGYINASERATRGTGLLGRAAGELAGTLGAIGITEVAFGIARFGANAARASIQVESATNSFEALGLGAAGAEARVEQLIELSRNPGISFPQAIQAATRLETVGVSGERADAVIREFGNSLALVGSTDLSGILLGLTQIVSAGRVTTEEIRQITERSGLAAQAIREEFGSLIGDDIQKQLDAAGDSVQDFVDRLVNRLSTQGRAAVDSTLNSFQNLQNSVFLLSSAIGDRFTPALGAAARGISSFIDGITESISGTKDFTETLAELNAELSNAAGRVELREAIDGGVDALEAFIRQSEAAIRNNSVFFGGREDAILTGQINEAREALSELVGVQEQNIETEVALRAELAQQETELARIQGLQTDRNDLIAEQGRTAERASRVYLENLEAEEVATLSSIEELEQKLAAYAAVGMAAEESTDAATEGTQETTEATKELVVEVQRLTDVYNGLTQNIQRASEVLASLTRPGDADFYRLAAGEVEGYGGAINTVIPSLVNSEEEQDAFNRAVQAGIDATTEAVGDPLTDYINSIGLTSEAADNARSSIERASESTGALGGDAAVAEGRLRDFDDAFKLSEATIPRVTSAMREFTGTAPDIEKVERAVESTTRSVDDLLDTIEGVPGEITVSLGFIESAFNAIPDLLVDVANDRSIADAFGELGETVGNSLIESLSTTLTDNLSDALTDALAETEIGGALISGDIVGALSGAAPVAAALAAPVGVFAASVAAFAIAGEAWVAAFGGETRAEPITPADVLLAGGRNVNLPELAITLPQLEGLDFSGLGLLEALGLAPPDRGFITGVQGGPGPQNAQQFLAQHSRTLGLTPPRDDQERGVVRDVFADGQADGLAEAELLQNLNLSNIQTAADTAVDVFTEAINAPRRTLDSINAAFTTLEPQLRTLYDTLFEGIAGEDGIINTAEEEIAFNELGTFQQFIARYEGLRDMAIEAVNASRNRLETLSQQIATDDVVGTFRDSLLSPGQTIDGLIEAWDTNVVPSINALYDQLFSNIAGDDGFINTTEEQIAYAQLGSREDFTADFRTNILEPGIESLQSIASQIEGITQDRELQTAFDGFNTAILSPGQTIEGLTSYWENEVVPTLRETYDFLRNEIIGEDGLISPEENLRLIQMGLDIPFENWAQRHEDNILTPGIQRLESAAQIIASITQDREVESVTELFDMELQAPGQTIAGITMFWETTVTPVLRDTYNFLRAEIIGEDGIISPEELAQLTQAGLDIPFENWEGNFRNDILTPGISSLQQATNTIAGITQGRELDDLFMGFNSALEAPGATVAGVTQYWIDNVDPVLMEIYEFERGLIIGEDGLISPQELAQLTQAGLDLPFTDWAQTYKDQVFTPGTARLSGILTSIGVLTQEGELGDVLGMFNAALEAPGATIEGLGTYWQENVTPVLRTTFDTLRAEIIGADGLISPSELLELTRAGLNVPFEDWAGRYETDILQPAITNLEEGAAHLTSTELSTDVDTLIENFRDAAAAPGATIAALTEAWNTTVVPALRLQYGNLFSSIAGEDGLINTALEQADLLQLGTEEDFLAGFTGDIFNPLIQSLNTRTASTGRRTDRFNIRQARFNLGGATSEQGFDDLFGILATAIDTFYDNEEARIQALGLSVAETTQLLAENDQARMEELRALSNTTNTFAEDRIDSEMRVQDILTDLRDNEVAAEMDRLTRIEGLHQAHADQLMQIEESRLQAQSDSRREHFRDQEDIILDTARRLFDEPIENVGQLTGQQLREIYGDTGFIENISDLRRTERREDIEAAIDVARATDAATQSLTNSLLESEMGLSVSRNDLLARSVVNLEALVTQSVFTSGARGRVIEQLAGLGIMLPDLSEILDPIGSLPPSLADTSGGTPVPVEIVSGTQQVTPTSSAISQPMVINNPVTVIVQLDDGTLTQVEGRLASRSDQGLSVLDV